MDSTGEVLQQPGGDDDLKKGLEMIKESAITFREHYRLVNDVPFEDAKELSVAMFMWAKEQGCDPHTAAVAVGIMFESVVTVAIEDLTDGDQP